MVIRVEAGAVAVAMAPSSSANPQPRLGKLMPTKIVTKTPATMASSKVMTITLGPLLFKTSFLKNLPTPKAMNPNAKSLRKDIPSIISGDTRSNTNGPIKMPESM